MKKKKQYICPIAAGPSGCQKGKKAKCYHYTPHKYNARYGCDDACLCGKNMECKNIDMDAGVI